MSFQFKQMIMNHRRGSQSAGYKVAIDCKAKLIPTGTTQDWLESLTTLATLDDSKKDMDDRKILSGILDKHQRIVAKVALAADNIYKELQVSRKLKEKRVKCIMHYYCYFECADDIKKYTAATTVQHMCEQTGMQIQVLLMEHISNSSVGTFAWTPTTLPALKSLCKQFVCTMVDAFTKCGFVHGDTNLQNMLFKNTTVKDMTWNTLTIPTVGVKLVIMDFEFSKFDAAPTKFNQDIRRFCGLVFDYLANFFCYWRLAWKLVLSPTR